jgi:membrane protein required for colicin V production
MIKFDLLNYIDICIITLVFVSVLFGIIRGFIKSVLSLIGWICSIFISYKYNAVFKDILSSYINSETLLIISSYGILLILSLVTFAFLNFLLSTIISGLTGGFLDRVLGSLFGFLRGAFIVSLIYVCAEIVIISLDGLDNSKEDKILPDIKKAQFYPLLKEGRSILLELTSLATNKKITNFADFFLNESINNKFVDEMIKKMYQEMSDEEVNKIEEEISEKSIDNNKKEIARHIMQHYQSEDRIGNIDKQSLDKLQNILNK